MKLATKIKFMKLGFHIMAEPMLREKITMIDAFLHYIKYFIKFLIEI